jgi:hypothetical protein
MAVPAGVVRVLPVSALVAFILVPSECRSPATGQIRKCFLLAGTKMVLGFKGILILDQEFTQVILISLVFHSSFI